MFKLPIPKPQLPWRPRPPEALASTLPVTNSVLRIARHWDLRRGVPLGRDTTGQDVSLSVTGGPILIDGAAGAGRTNAAQNIAAAAALDRDTHLIVYLRHPDHGREIARALHTIAATGRSAHYLLALVVDRAASRSGELRALSPNRLTLTAHDPTHRAGIHATGRRRSRLGLPGCALLTTADGSTTELDVSYITRNDLALLVERARTARSSAGTLTNRPPFDFDDPDLQVTVIDPKAGTDWDPERGGNQ